MSFAVEAYGAPTPKAKLEKMKIERRTPGKNDVRFDVLYCGICHSDLHQLRQEWENYKIISDFPLVAGHELVGRVTEVGENVTNVKAGDYVGVGCMVDSCRQCQACHDHLEMFCKKCTYTYGSAEQVIGGSTHGGYSKQMVCDKDFIIHVPSTLVDRLPGVAPLFCAGITTFSPLRRYKAGPGKKVGVVGLGGLGHVAIKLAHAMGAEVVMFTTSPSKMQDGKRLGADRFILSKDPEQMQAAVGTLDLILDTVSADHDLRQYMSCLRYNGTLVLLGLPINPLTIYPVDVVMGNRSLSGSNIGSIQETQEMIDFCAEHNVTVDYELIEPSYINEALERLQKSDVKYRFVIDTQKI